MKELDNLIVNKSEALDNNVDAQQNVGNSMHYPMMITMNGDNAEAAFKKFRSSLRQFWRNGYEKIVFSKINIENGVEYNQFGTNEKQSLSALADDLANISNKDYFREVSRFCFYNIIDTSCIDNFDDFKKYYNSIESASEQIGRSIYSLSIILLDDRKEKEAFSTEVKSFLKDNKKYNGQIILATKTKASYTLNVSDLFDTVASIIVLSNNDADTEADDASYNARFIAFFDKKDSTLTAAHSVQKRPTADIVKQMVGQIIASADNLIGKTAPLDESDFKKILKIDNNGSIIELEKIFDSINFSFDYNDIKYLPYKSIPKSDDFTKISYKEFADTLFEGEFEQYAEEKCKILIDENKGVIDSVLSAFDNEIKQSIIAWQCLDRNFEHLAKKSLESYNLGNVSQIGTIEDYYKSYIKKYIRQTVFVDHFKKLFSDMKENADATILSFNKFKEAISFLNVREERLGKLYKNQTDSYLGSIDGEKKLKLLLASGNDISSLVKISDSILDGVVENNSDIFALSFIDEWVKRMGQEENTVLSLVQNEFKNELESQLFYYTVSTYPSELITLYTFHIGDRNWNNETPLYKQIKNGINDNSNIYFVNVGYDYKVEALKLFDITEIL